MRGMPAKSAQPAAQCLAARPELWGIKRMPCAVKRPARCGFIRQRQGHARHMPVLSHLLKRLAHHLRQQGWAALAYVLTDAPGQLLALHAVLPQLTLLQQIAYIKHLQQPAIGVRLYPASGTQHALADGALHGEPGSGGGNDRRARCEGDFRCHQKSPGQ